MEPWGTPVKTVFHDEIYPFKITLINLPKFSKR